MSLKNAGSLGPKTEVTIEKGAILDLNFKGRMTVRTLTIDGKQQPAGIYDARTVPNRFTGTGVLIVQQ